MLLKYEKMEPLGQLNNDRVYDVFSNSFSFLERICKTYATPGYPQNNCNAILEYYKQKA
jgi:hypothetical protein